MLKPAKAEGLVAPNWSDSGDVPVGEVTELKADQNSLDSMVRMWVREEIAGPVARHIGFRFKDWSDVQPKPAKPSDPNAKPAMPALSRIAGEAYRGLGWCDE
jgi:hypothetical protein